MKLSEFIRAAQRPGAPADADPEVVLYCRTTGREYRLDPDSDEFGFEILFGEDEVVVEFGRSLDG